MYMATVTNVGKYILASYFNNANELKIGRRNLRAMSNSCMQ